MNRYHGWISLFLLPTVVAAAPLPRFPPGAIWNQDVSAPALKHPGSDAMIGWLQSHGGWGTGRDRLQIDFSMVVLHADSAAPSVPVVGYPPGKYYTDDCDAPGQSFPLPAGGAIEGSVNYQCDNSDTGKDCHLLVVRGSELFESYRSNVSAGKLQSQCAVRWNLQRVYPPQGRGEQCSSADAAGFPIAPLLFNADEVHAAMQSQGDLGHAIRFILPNARMRAGVFVVPATHAGGPRSNDADSIPYGSRLRLKAGFDINAFSAKPAVRVLLRTLRKYGMVLADGGNVPLTAEADTYTTHKWNETGIGIDSHSLFGIEAADFEVVAAPPPIALTYDCMRTPDDPDTIFSSGFD